MDTANLLREAADDIEHLQLPKGARFNMGDFGRHPLDHKPGITVETACGTRACFAGWLSLIPKWRDRGFSSCWAKICGKWVLMPTSPEGDWEGMGERVLGADKCDLHDIFYMTQSSRAQVVAAVRELADKYDD